MLSLLCLAAAGACSGAREGGERVGLAGTWKLVPRDDPGARLPDYDDSGAMDIELPGSWPGLMEGNDDLTATVWLRKRIEIPASLKGTPLVLSMGRIAVADDTYFNGVHVGSEGSFPAGAPGLRYGYAWQKERHYFVPAIAVRPGGGNVVAVRVFSHVIGGVAGNLG